MENVVGHALSVVSYIGVNGIKVITRIMGLILAVIGTQMVIAGVDGAIKLAQAG